MWFLHNAPIKRKLILVILLTSCAAMFVTAGALFSFQLITFRQSFTRDLSALGEIIANHSTATVAFKDKATAKEMLEVLRVKPHIIHAQIRLNDGSIFASYGQQAQLPPHQAGATNQPISSADGYVTFRKALILDGEAIGELQIQSNYHQEFIRLLRLYLVVLGLVLTLSILLTYLLSARLQRVISQPILKLAETARVVAERKDYGVRAEILEQDEIGQLTEAFNQMLGQIQAQDAALRLSQQKFETLVHSIDGIVWEADPADHRFYFVSQQAERLLGYPAEQWIDQAPFWEERLHPDDRQAVLAQLRRGTAQLKPFALEFRLLAVDGREVWVRNSTAVMVDQGRPKLLRGVMLDITERKRAEKELEALHQQVLAASRQAGMAEVATGVLHNVGNVLNSVNVSATLVQDQVRKSRLSHLVRSVGLIRERSQDLGHFFTQDPQGRKLPDFLAKLCDHLRAEQDELLRELDALTRNIDHIKEIVAMQQSYARVSGLIETIAPDQLVEDALRINAAGLVRHRVEVLRHFADVPPVAVDKHKVLQILINLISNGKYAVSQDEKPEKRLTVRIAKTPAGQVAISVEDNGLGIAPENLTKVFQHGFTTKKDGHGFGLHSGANAAREMGGHLIARSDGLGCGATFILELPVAVMQQAA